MTDPQRPETWRGGRHPTVAGSAREQGGRDPKAPHGGAGRGPRPPGQRSAYGPDGTGPQEDWQPPDDTDADEEGEEPD